MGLCISDNHPYEHKLSGNNYLLRRLHTYPVTNEKVKEINTIRNILRNNEYDMKIINKFPPPEKTNYTS
jgi:hypothetical protein